MKKEYRYKAGVVSKYGSFIWFTLVTLITIYSLYLYGKDGNFEQVIIYVIIFVVFSVLFRYNYLVYYKRVPVLTLEEDKLLYFGVTGQKEASYDSVFKLDFKTKTWTQMFYIFSSETSPIRINLQMIEGDLEYNKKEIERIINERQGKKNES